MRDPVYGCMGAIAALQQQVQALEAELTAVKTEILKYKFRSATNSTVLPTTNAASLLSPTGGTNNVSAACGPTTTTTAPTASASIAPASSSSSMYAGAGSASSTDYSSITNENNVSYFS